MQAADTADRPETETPIGQARQRFYEAGRTLATALKDCVNVDPEDGERIAKEFVEAFDAMEALTGDGGSAGMRDES